MPTIQSAVNIACSPSAVFEFVTTPGHWPRWHPSSLRVSGSIDHPLELGEECTEHYIVAGRRGTCVWKVTECVPCQKWSIAALAQGGGEASITYALSPAGDGTRFLRSMTYGMPNPLLGLLDALFLRKRIAHESEEAVLRLKATLERT